MMLPVLLLALFMVGILVCLCVGLPRVCKAISYVALFLGLFVTVLGGHERSFPEWKTPWISSFNINFHLQLNGLSFWFILLVFIMGLLAVFAGRPKATPHLFYASILWSVTFSLGIFLAADVFLFFMFWEAELLPTYLMLIVFGSKDRKKASLRYIAFTQLSGLLLLISIVGTVIAHYHVTGELSFDYQKLCSIRVPLETQNYLLLGFLLAFLLKLPSVPVHGWIKTFFFSAPVSIILASILAKTSVFGLMKFTWPLVFDAMTYYSWIIMLLGAITTIYGAVLAFSQREPKAVIAYGSLSHAGLLLLGVSSPEQVSFFGALVLTICQALSTGGVLLLLDRLYMSDAAVDLRCTGGLLKLAPEFSIYLLFFLLAGIGLPIFGNFVGEWLILLETFFAHPWIAIVAAAGIVSAAVYSIWLFQRLCFGSETLALAQHIKLKPSELLVCGCVIVVLLILGLFPGLMTSPSSGPISSLVTK